MTSSSPKESRLSFLKKIKKLNNDNHLLVGLESSFNQLRVELTRSSTNLAMFGIVGMAGIGKTTLAKMLFKDPYIVQHFHIRAWVNVSQSHTKTHILLLVLKCINHQRNYDINTQTESSLEEDLYRSLIGQKYLIVVDDLWSVQTWNEMRRPFSDDSVGSRILFTSRQSNVIQDLQCKNIHQILESDDCFPGLQQLVLKFCGFLEEVPEQIGDIPTLSCMRLRHCSNATEQSAKDIQEQQEEYGHNIEVHILTKINE